MVWEEKLIVSKDAKYYLCGRVITLPAGVEPMFVLVHLYYNGTCRQQPS